jgi:hypothetical protein
MPLQCALFKDDEKLKACLISDPAHVTPGARGDHVGKIQSALVLVDKAAIDPAEFGAKHYGPSTAKAVLDYKTKRSIINPAYQTAADNVVGKMTIDRLDKDMLAKEKESPPPAPPKAGLVIVPFNEPEPLLISRTPHDISKSDLRSTPVPLSSLPISLIDRLILEEMRKQTTWQLELDMQTELLLAPQIGAESAKDFFRNLSANATITRSPLSRVSQMVFGSKEFQDFSKDEVQPSITKAVRASAVTGILDYRILAQPGGLVQVSKKDMLGYDGFRNDVSRHLHVLIGSFQGMDLYLANFEASASTRRYKATLIYHFFDHFGVDDSDVALNTSLHGTMGQKAFWILQHERRPGHMPYIHKVELASVDISDSF